MKYKCRLKVLFFVLIIIIYVILIKCDEPCKNADTILDNFWNKLNNINHGNVLIINIKNFYCPACNRYLEIWKKVESDVFNFEKSNVSLFAFDCSCHLFRSYCNFFDVSYYPSFRLLFPVFDKIEDAKYKYIEPSNNLGNKIYKGNLLLAYREINRIKNIGEFHNLMQMYLCNNVNFNHSNLKSCILNLSNIHTSNSDKALVEKGIEKSYSQEGTQVEKWNVNNSRDDIKHDIMIGLLFTLKQHILIGNGINYSSLEPFLDMLNIVSLIYTDLSENLYELSNIIRNYKYNFKQEELKNAIQNVHIKEYKLDERNNFNFKVCEENSLLCSFWLLYHKVSIYCLQYNKEKYAFFLEVITNYTKNYLNCKECTDHFMNAQNSCYYGFCNIHSAESVVLFLWRIHNGVTLRTMHEYITLDIDLSNKNLNKKKFLNKDIAFPSEKQCPNCRSGVGFTKIIDGDINKLEKESYNDQYFDAIDAFNTKNVLMFLIDYYS